VRPAATTEQHLDELVVRGIVNPMICVNCVVWIHCGGCEQYSQHEKAKHCSLHIYSLLSLRQRDEIHIGMGLDQEWVVAGVVMVENRGMWCDAKDRIFSLSSSVNSKCVYRKHSDSGRTLNDENFARRCFYLTIRSARSRGSMLGYTLC
jgi:hypothetical protein